MSAKTKVLIFAGTHEQAVDWRRQKGYSQQEAEYVSGAERLRGRSTGGVPRVFIGTFYQRADWRQIEDTLLVTDLHTARPALAEP